MATHTAFNLDLDNVTDDQYNEIIEKRFQNEPDSIIVTDDHQIILGPKATIANIPEHLKSLVLKHSSAKNDNKNQHEDLTTTKNTNKDNEQNRNTRYRRKGKHSLPIRKRIERRTGKQPVNRGPTSGVPQGSVSSLILIRGTSQVDIVEAFQLLNAKDPSWLGFGSRCGVYRLQPAALLDPCNVFKVGFTEDEKIKSLKQCILDLHVKDSEESQSEIPATPGQEQPNISSVIFNSSRPTPSTSFESQRPSTSQSCDSDKPAVLEEFIGNRHAIKSGLHACKFLKLMDEDEEEIEYVPTVAETSLEQMVNNEIQRYLTDVSQNKEHIKAELVAKPLQLLPWWKKNANKYPYLSGAVKAYLCVPSTSCNSERAFSTATDLITKKRNRLHPENVEKLTFLRDNFKLIPNP